MPKLTINYCVEIMISLQKQGFVLSCPLPDLVKTIRLQAGYNQATVNKYMAALQFYGFLTRDEEKGIVVLNYEAIHKYDKKKQARQIQ